MKTINQILNLILPFSYLLTVIVYAFAFLSKKPTVRRYKTPFLLFTMFLHLVYIICRTIYLKHPPIITVFDVFCLLAFSIAASYRVIEILTGMKNTGVLILFISLIFQTISSIFIQEIFEVKQVLRSNILGLHVLSALIGYSAFTIAAVYGLLYLFQYNNLKSNRFGIFFDKLPNLEHLEHLTRSAIIFGFILLTVAIIIGIVWLPIIIDDYSLYDPKLVGTIIVWFMYAAEIYIIRKGRGTGKQITKFAISALVITLGSLTVLNLYFKTFHRFF
jgi:HemX protein